jgi:hypothetical protein
MIHKLGISKYLLNARKGNIFLKWIMPITSIIPRPKSPIERTTTITVEIENFIIF